MDTQTIKPEDQLLKAKKALEDHTKTLGQEEARQKNINARAAELQGNLPGLEKSTEECRRRKDEIFEQELAGEADQQKIDQVKKALALAESELSDCKEKMAAIDRINKKETGRLQKLREEEPVLQREFWRVLYESLKSEILDQVGDLVNQAHNVRMFSGGGDRPSTLANIFGPDRLEENIKIRNALEKEYFGQD